MRYFTWKLELVSNILRMIAVGPLISFIGAYNYKIKILKIGENSSPWTKFDPLTTNIFWIYNFGGLDIIKFVAFHKS